MSNLNYRDRDYRKIIEQLGLLDYASSACLVVRLELGRQTTLSKTPIDGQ